MMRKTITTLYIIFQLMFSLAYGQNEYGIYVTPSLTPPYSLKLSDYCKFGSQQLLVAITVNDLTVMNLPVKLRIRMETVGVTIENPPTINTTPIYLSGGTTSIIFGDDLTDYFNIDNLVFRGYSKDTYRRTGQLPEGFYKFTVEVLHHQTNRPISNQGTATAWFVLGKPPVLKSPSDNAQLGQYKGMPLTFSWLASNVGSPVSANSIQYKFEMWEMRVAGVAPNTVASSIPVFHEYTTFNTTYTLYTEGLLMEPGMQYAWRVTASDLSGFVPFEQDGHSDIWTFTYKCSCDSVSELTSSYRGKSGQFSWEPDERHSSFNVEMRNPSTGWSTQSQSYENKAEFFDLKYGSTYEMRVQGVCDGDPENTSDFTHWQPLTIPEPQPLIDSAGCPNCACNDSLPNVELVNFELRQDLQPGDTIINKTGTTRFILKEVENTGNGTYKGIFLFWAEIWKLKFICEYWDLQVNTDDVIVNMDFESVYNPQFLIDVDATIDYLNNLANAINELTVNTTIKDTLTFNQSITSIYVNSGDSVIAVTTDEDGNISEVVLHNNVDDLSKTLIQGENGEEYVVTGDGEVMGVDEYRNTGGNDRKIEELKEENETDKLSSSTPLNFVASQNQLYGFDSYSEIKSALQNEYPTLQNGYRAPFKSVASFSTDKVGFTAVNGDLVFKDEMGIPALKSGNELTVRGSSGGSELALYAWKTITDTTEEVIGKLNILSFDEQTKRLYIVPVNDAKVPDAATLQSVLNKIYSQAVTKWEVVSPGGIENVVFENGNMTHGGTSAIAVYNSDQKTIVNAFENKYGKLEGNACYLFFVENVQYKERSIAGYMPLQRQVGFIYDYPGLNIVAHELAHGSFNLYHTFSPEKFIAAEQATYNLLDYKGGTELWKHQWDLIHDPDNMLFAFLQDEEEGEARAVKEYYITIDGKKVLKIDLNEFRNEFDIIMSLSESERANTERKIIKVYIPGSEKNDYTISSLYVKNGEEKGAIPEIAWDLSQTKDKKVSFNDQKDGSEDVLAYYNFKNTTSEPVSSSTITTSSTTTTTTITEPLYKIEIVRVVPNIAFKQDGEAGYIIKIDKANNTINEIELTGKNVSLCPVFLTYGERDGIDPITDLVEKNEKCTYLVNSIKFNEIPNDLPISLEWKEYSLDKAECTYEFVTGEVSTKGIIKTAGISPFVTVIRGKSNEETGYYIEDYYSTSFGGSSAFPSLRDQNNTMKTGGFDVLGSAYKIPIVHYKTQCNVKLLLADIPRNENPSPLQYKIGDQVIELGKEFTIQAPPNGTILDIKDVDGNIKGKIEFRQINESQLTPTLNIVTINTEVTGVSHSTVVSDVNAIYNTMNVSWQAGNHIVLNIIIEDLDIKNNDEHLELILNNLRKHEDYKANQYYMIISPNSGDFGGFAAPSLTDNWFVIQKTYDKRVPAHELGHCSGLDEYAVNIGLLSASERNKSSDQNMQYLTTNIMGYSKQGFSSANPLMDFYSWQIPKVRQQISIRINTGQ